MQFMSLAEYARHRGVSQAAVTKAKNEGRITLERGPRGKRGVYAEKADLQWEANTQVDAIVEAAASPGTGKTYNELRAEREEIQAKLLQLKYDELSGTLVKASEVEREWAEAGSLIKNKILSIPSKIKQRFSEISIEQYEYLDLLCRETLEEIADVAQDRTLAGAVSIDPSTETPKPK